jgi:hypothetical protein
MHVIRAPISASPVGPSALAPVVAGEAGRAGVDHSTSSVELFGLGPRSQQVPGVAKTLSRRSWQRRIEGLDRLGSERVSPISVGAFVPDGIVERSGLVATGKVTSPRVSD